MKKFLDDNFLLENATAQTLYHKYAKEMPVIDYHCHLPVDQIANDINFQNLTQAWLYGDHYKWRAMRANGVSEDYITGTKSDFEKFEKWAETVPYTLRNPLYHWTHLELQRYFDVHEILSPATAKAIFDECTAKLQTPEFSVRNILRKMNVKAVVTTDDPLDNLEYHIQIKKDHFEIIVLPAFRPDKAMNVSDLCALQLYIKRLEEITESPIHSIADYLSALKLRHDYFAENGCKVSDHGLECMFAEDFTDEEIAEIFHKILAGDVLELVEVLKFKSAMLFHFALWNHEKGWVQQFHLGALRNTNSRLLENLGPDTGFDSIGDYPQGVALGRFLNKLDKDNRLAKTILYNLNPADNEVFASMIGNFNDGTVAGKIQWGSAWWFLDQKDGMAKQINTLSNMGLISRFLGMLTDSRSFLSFPRHEYFRRILCNLFGTDVENGELPNNLDLLGKMVQDISYNNTKTYFDF